jgi:arsenate reductase (thioredoxin)
VTDKSAIAPDKQVGLSRLTAELQTQFQSVVGPEAVGDVVADSYDRLATRSVVTGSLLGNTERLAVERLHALAHARDHSTTRVPGVLFLCVHNAGRSQMALGWFAFLAGDRAVAWSGGSAPVDDVNPAAVAVMAEVGIDISRQFPKPWTDEFFEAADVVVTMGCGDSCPFVPAKRYEDWELDDPSGRPVEEVRTIRDAIRARVVSLLGELGVDTPSTDPSTGETRT